MAGFAEPELTRRLRERLERAPSWLWLGLALLAALLRARHPLQGYIGEIHAAVAPGEVLLHALGFPNTFYMPSLGVLAALVQNHLPQGSLFLLLLFVHASRLLLAFNLGRLIAGVPAGLLAAAAAFLYPTDNAEQLLYGLCVLCAANLLAWSAKAPSLKRSALAGFGVGATLLVKSPLFLLPWLIALWDLFKRPERPLRPALLRGALLLLCSYVLLVPWVRLNRVVHGRFIPFEAGRADANLITGALGVVFTVEGDTRALMGDSKGKSVYRWALERVREEPGRYFSAVGKRLGHVFLLHPFLILLALAGAWLCRKREAAQTASLVAACFALVHCLLSIEARYFDPLWLLLAPLAGCALVRGEPRKEMGFAWLAAVPLFAFSLFVTGLAAAYPARVVQGVAGFDRALADFPDDPWLRVFRGYLRLDAEEQAGAMADFTEALRACRPWDGECAALQGLLSSREAGPDAMASLPDSQDVRVNLMRALRWLELGRRNEARAAYARAAELHLSASRTIRGAEDAELPVLAKLEPKDKELLERYLQRLLLFWPAKEREKLSFRLKDLVL